jgi:hypothetical protein
VFTTSSSRRRRKAADPDVAAARDMLLDELLGLERARAAGTVGPKTYDRARRDLMESLARLIVAYS